MIVKSFAVLALLLLGSTSWSFENVDAPKNYTLRFHIPQMQKSCAEEAQAITQSFINGTGIKEVQTNCVGTTAIADNKKSFPQYILILSYTSTKPVSFYTAKFSLSLLPSSQVPDSSEGAYSNYEDCLSDISSQTMTFENQTESEVLYANCVPGNSIVESNYILQITGTGKTTKKLYVFNSFENSNADDVAVVSNLLMENGAWVTKRAGDQFFFYAAQPLRILNDTMEVLQNMNECTLQLNTAEQIYKTAGATTVIPRCQEKEYGISLLKVISLNAPMIRNDNGYGSANYFSFDECFQDLPRVLKEARDRRPTRPDSVLGGICHRSTSTTGQYNITIYSKYY